MNYISATEAHIPFISETYLDNIESLHGTYRSEAVWRELLADPACAYYIVCAPAPVAWFRLDFEEETLWLGMLQVKPAHQRKGIGRFILSVLEAVAKEKGFHTVGIHTTEDNLPARSLYTAAGYTVTEIGPCTTADGVDRVGYTFQKTI